MKNKAKVADHSINTSLLESIEKVNPFDELEIIENIDFKDIERYNNVSCVFMYSRNINNINDTFHYFYQNIILSQVLIRQLKLLCNLHIILMV